jgi:hypothetical protein
MEECKKLCGKKDCKLCFKKSFASHHRSKWWSERNKTKPNFVYKHSKTKYEFFCDICEHYFYSSIGNITKIKSVWCPYCAIPCKTLCDNDKCKICYDKSCASHEISKWWGENNILPPRKIQKSSNKKYNFKCCDCKFEFSYIISNLTRRNYPGCPHCSEFKKQICNDSKCKICSQRSFSSHPKAKYWSERNEKPPSCFYLSSREKAEFKCHNCNHYFTSIISHISSKKPSWCPYCCKPSLKLCDDNDCEYCYNNSFSSHPKAKYWSERNEKLPRFFLKGSSFKAEFKCEKNHYFTSSIDSITRRDTGTWCPYCLNKTEQKYMIGLKNNIQILLGNIKKIGADHQQQIDIIFMIYLYLFKI